MAEKVFQVNPEGKTTKEVALEGIDRLRSFWSSIGAPETLADYGIDNSKIGLMAKKATINGNIGRFSNMSKEDVEKVLSSIFINIKTKRHALISCVTVCFYKWLFRKFRTIILHFNCFIRTFPRPNTIIFVK